MGKKAVEPIELFGDELVNYLRVNHSVYMDVEDKSYYLTDVNDHYWRAQATDQFNDKGHYVDISEPVPTLSEFLADPAIDGKSVSELAPTATFYASEK